MIQDKTIDETLVELARTMKALQALRAERKAIREERRYKPAGSAIHAAAKRASLDLTRKLADLRSGR